MLDVPAIETRPDEIPRTVAVGCGAAAVCVPRYIAAARAAARGVRAECGDRMSNPLESAFRLMLMSYAFSRGKGRTSDCDVFFLAISPIWRADRLIGADFSPACEFFPAARKGPSCAPSLIGALVPWPRTSWPAPAPASRARRRSGARERGPAVADA